jgi:hypothetical protein
MTALARTFDKRFKDAIRYAETAQWFLTNTFGAGQNGVFRYGDSPAYSFSTTPSAFTVVVGPGAAIVGGIPIRITGSRTLTFEAVDEKNDGRYDVIGVNANEQVVARAGTISADPTMTGLVKLWRVVRRFGETQITSTDNGTDAYLVDVRDWVN